MSLRTSATWAIPYVAVELRLEMAKGCLALGDASVARELSSEIPQDPTVLSRPRFAQRRGARLARHTCERPHLQGYCHPHRGRLRLLPHLQTNLMYPEIAARLYVSKNTVKTQAK